MRADWQLGRVVNRSALGPAGTVLSRNNGESREVHRLEDHPGWLLKVYRPGARTVQADRTLDWLVSLIDKLSPAERQRIRDGAAWPVCRVVDSNQRTVGVVFQEAPTWFRTRLRVGPGHSTEDVLQVDWLCMPAAACRRRGLPFLDFDQRLAVCRSLIEVAAVLEKHDAVYGDWSYRNAFWSVTERSGFLIDVDSCGYRSRKAVQTQAWRDPLLNGSPTIDVTTDRYGSALLVARCLTAERDRSALLPALRTVTSDEGQPGLYQVLHASLAAPTRADRPPIKNLLSQLNTRSSPVSPTSGLLPGANVAGWERPQVHTTRGRRISPPDQANPVETSTSPQTRPPVRPPARPPVRPLNWRDEFATAILDHPIWTGFVVAAALIILFLLIL